MTSVLKIEDIFKEDFELDNELIGKENSTRFDYIYKNDKEIYFIKRFEDSLDYDEVIKYEDYILDYQYKIISNNNFIAYNLNFILVTSGKVDNDIRVKLERDKYTCRKIVLNEKNIEQDIYLLPFLKKEFVVGEIGGDGDELLLKKCKNISEIEKILSVLKKEKTNDIDINEIINLLDGELHGKF